MVLYLIIISILNCIFLIIFGIGINTALGMWGNLDEIEMPILIITLIIFIISVIIPWVLHRIYKSLKNIKAVIIKWLSILFSLIPLIIAISWYTHNYTAYPEELKKPTEDIQNIEINENQRSFP